MGIPIPVITLAPAASPVAGITGVDITGAATITGAAQGITAGDFMQVMSPVRMARLTLEASIADPSGESPTPFCGQQRSVAKTTDFAA
jgi:hypothetical protein